MDLLEVMRTTFAARDFTDDEVPDDVLYDILDHARFAPSGGNRQGWKVVVVREQATREALLPLMVPVFQRYIAQVQAGEAPWNTVVPTALSDEAIAATQVPKPFLGKLVQAPVLLLVFVDLRLVASMDSGLDRIGVISGASVYPLVWNILLAARNVGLGGTPTTFLAAAEPEVQDLLGVPDGWAFAAMLPMGRPEKQLTKLRRKPVEDFVVQEHFSGLPLTRSGSNHSNNDN